MKSNIKKEIKRKIRKGNKLFIRIAEATGIPHGYSATAAWFAERVLLGSAVLAAVAFSAGALFVLKLSDPIGNSHFYEIVSSRARLASQSFLEFTNLVKENHEERDFAAEELVARKNKLREYLKSKKSPFAEDEAALDAFVNSKNMKLMVAISFVESTFGKHCYYYNCSGIGGTPPTLRKYDSYASWISDFDSLLERRYKDLPPEKFIGLYVQPGSPNWLYGVKQVLREFEEQGIY